MKRVKQMRQATYDAIEGCKVMDVFRDGIPPDGTWALSWNESKPDENWHHWETVRVHRGEFFDNWGIPIDMKIRPVYCKAPFNPSQTPPRKQQCPIST